MKLVVLVIIVFIFAVSPWLVRSGDFFYIQGSSFSDLTISHLPNATYLIDSIREFGEVPFWGNSILSGAPFAADPLAGIWYPPGWIAFLLPQPTGFNITALLHLIWGALGMFLFLRASKIHLPAALTGGLAFLLMPKLFSHLAAGHITLVYAVSWTPWIFLAELNRTANPSSNLIQKIAPGILIGIIFLADPRWMIYAAVAWLVYSLSTSRKLFTSRQFADTKIYFLHILTQGFTAAGIAALLILPLVEFTSLSTRSTLTALDVLQFSLPPAQLAGVLLPNIGGYAEWQIYPGSLIVILVLYAIFNSEIRKKASFWLWLSLAALILSLGSFWPGAEWFAGLPVANLLRVPSRVWFLGGMGLIVTATFGLDDLLFSQRFNSKPDPLLAILPIAFIALSLTAGLGIIGITPPIGFVWGTIGLIMGVGWFLLARRNNIKRFLVPIFVLFLILDLAGVNWLGMSFRKPVEILSEGNDVAKFLLNQDGVFRVYSPSYSIPQHTAAAAGIQLVDGINPLHLSEYDEFLADASGVPATGYSVTVPKFATGSPSTDNRGASIDTQLMGLLNVEYVASSYELPDPRLIEVWRGEGEIVYKNLDVLPRAWIQREGVAVGSGPIQPVSIDQVNQDKMQITGNGPGLLVISIPDYPGWSAEVDGQDANIIRIANLIMGVKLSPGAHKILIEFKPILVNWGLIISTITWIAILVAALTPGRKRGKPGENS